MKPPAVPRALARLLPRWSVAAALIVFLSAGSLMMLLAQAAQLPQLDELSYGDSYILYDVLHLRATGQIYRDLSLPPYSPAQYSPLVYRLYAIAPSNLARNPFLGPRLIALAVFLLCICVAASLARALLPFRFAWLWGFLLAASISPMEGWAMQVRGDFPAILFSLTAVRLLMASSPQTALLAGLCAGLATQFKFVYVAALVTGALWLACRRKWRELALFCGAGALASIGLYFAFWLKEPRMLAQLMTVSPGVRDVRGCLFLISKLIDTPLILLALPALPAAFSRVRPRLRLVLLFALLSFCIAALTDLQAGGNINYFFEGLFALVPVAAWGCLRLLQWSRRSVGLRLFLTGAVLFQLLVPEARSFAHNFVTPRTVAANNQRLRAVESALQGLHIFSTVPRMALFDPRPALTEPYLLSYMRRMGKGNAGPLFDEVRRGEFNVAVTADDDLSWRGIPHVDPELRKVILAAYRPLCVVAHDVIYLPIRSGADQALKDRLARAGCVAYPPPTLFP
jgi:hypothetical protein